MLKKYDTKIMVKKLNENIVCLTPINNWNNVFYLIFTIILVLLYFLCMWVLVYY